MLHGSVFYKGILAGSFKGTYVSPKTSWCFAPYFFLGTYEKELHFLWDYLSAKAVNLNEIYVIGAAEGYYVCGLGRKYSSSRITAFESTEESRKILKINVKANRLSERVTILGACTDKILMEILQDKIPDFLLCDIEGYENLLFTENILDRLKNTVFLIETHPPYDLLRKISFLQKTHNVIQVDPMPRVIKDYTLNGFAPPNKKLDWMNERRPFPTPWIVAFPIIS